MKAAFIAGMTCFCATTIALAHPSDLERGRSLGYRALMNAVQKDQRYSSTHAIAATHLSGVSIEYHKTPSTDYGACAQDSSLQAFVMNYSGPIRVCTQVAWGTYSVGSIAFILVHEAFHLAGYGEGDAQALTSRVQSVWN